MSRLQPWSASARRIALGLPCLWLLAACDSSQSAGASRQASVDQAGKTPGATDPSASGSNPASGGMSGSSFGTSSGTGGSAITPAGTVPGGTPIMGMSGAAGGSATDPSGDGASDAGIDPAVAQGVAAGQLTAGEWNDLEHWQFWLKLHGSCGNDPNCPMTEAAQAAQHWRIDTRGIIRVVVKAGAAPVVDAAVTLRDKNQDVAWEARTDHAGQAQLFADIFAAGHGPYRVEVAAGSDSASADNVMPGAAHPIELSLPAAHAPAPSLDLMFLVDTTGSMGDELSYLQSELDDVLKNVRDNVGAQLALRTSVNFYRDHDDEYLLRPFPFTDKVADALGELADQRADGGGDTPEAADEALDDAIANHDWSAHASARLLFLVLDAPPHDGTDNIATVQRATRAAAAHGVELIPVVASGADKPTEFLLRSLAIATNGTYAFLTDDSGIGNSHLEPTIGQYEVELLNALLVRVIGERL